jgi:hypothetical protein
MIIVIIWVKQGTSRSVKLGRFLEGRKVVRASG